jgi:maleylacetoacetate isomerase
MIKMYGFWRSAASFRVRIALNLKGLAYTEEMIDLDAGEQNAPAYRAVNSQQVLPTLIFENSAKLTESVAILEYLDELHPTPALLPADPLGRARVRSIALLWAADHHPLIVPRIRRYLSGTLHQDAASVTGWIRHWLREGLALGEARLSAEAETGRFCHGDVIGMADLCLMSQMMAARGASVDTDAFPTISRITEACLAVDAVARALPMRQPGGPAAH